MRRIHSVLLSFFIATSISARKSTEVTVLQWNVWQEGSVVPGGFEAIVDEIARLRPDFVTFSEVRNYNNTDFSQRITEALKQRGETYYGFYSYDSGLLSRYPIEENITVFPENKDHGSIYKLTTRIGKRPSAFIPHILTIKTARIMTFVAMMATIGSLPPHPLMPPPSLRSATAPGAIMP